VSITNVDNVDLFATTNNPNIRICGMTVVSQRRINSTTWEYTLSAELTNTGPNVSGVTARLTQLLPGMQAVDNTSVFGAVNSGDTAKTNDTVTVRSLVQIPAIVFKLGIGFQWTVTVQP
jgi:hypothetical protein